AVLAALGGGREPLHGSIDVCHGLRRRGIARGEELAGGGVRVVVAEAWPPLNGRIDRLPVVLHVGGEPDDVALRLEGERLAHPDAASPFPREGDAQWPAAGIDLPGRLAAIQRTVQGGGEGLVLYRQRERCEGVVDVLGRRNEIQRLTTVIPVLLPDPVRQATAATREHGPD